MPADLFGPRALNIRGGGNSMLRHRRVVRLHIGERPGHERSGLRGRCRGGGCRDTESDFEEPATIHRNLQSLSAHDGTVAHII
jgi:hypothetical protein